ncbi:hypothetical protein D3C72_1850330 [compost metagenome]
MRASVHAAQQTGQIQLLAFAARIEPDAVPAEPGQLIPKGAVLVSAKGVVQYIRSAALVQLVQLRHEWGDADAARDQHMVASRLIQREQVAGGGDGKRVAHGHAVMQKRRPALGCRFAPHADLVVA